MFSDLFFPVGDEGLALRLDGKLDAVDARTGGNFDHGSERSRESDGQSEVELR